MKSRINKRKKGSSKRRSFFISKKPSIAPLVVDPTFDSRKSDHLVLSLDGQTQTVQNRFIDRIHLKATAFPEINFSDVSVVTQFNGQQLSAPFFISSMTSGTALGEPINEAFALLSQEKQILMGVGSQRKELYSESAQAEWKRIRKKYPRSLLLSNLGLSQLITTPSDQVKKIIENLEAVGLIIHCNAMQECIQMEGTPNFQSGLKTIEKLVHELDVPVIVKEVGFGFSQADLVRLNQTGVYAVDFSGRGGTNWARIEALRYPKKSFQLDTGFVFSDWGYDIQEWVEFHDKESVSYQFWSSGGIRNGLDIAKMVSTGAYLVGMAQPWLKSLVIDMKKKKLNTENLFQFYDKTHKELKIALFGCGYANLDLFRKNKAFYVR
ncbi:MAG: type 2 isopentenyl-diphosphate Delta-isomerase [Bdellovibrionaceae bacterium]|nr:type 2 isopentenyl-diphosphate Delta-isomerase [Pseudobdellovibrionaceae bacterium]